MERMRMMIREEIQRLGRRVTICGKENLETRAILIPVTSVSKEARSTQMLADGYLMPGTFELFTLPEISLEDAEVVCDGARRYLIRRRETFYCGETELYQWALLIRGGDTDAVT